MNPEETPSIFPTGPASYVIVKHEVPSLAANVAELRDFIYGEAPAPWPKQVDWMVEADLVAPRDIVIDPKPRSVEEQQRLVENVERKQVCPSYTRAVFDPVTFPGLVNWAAQVIDETTAAGKKIGAVAGCGHSGVLVAAAVAYKLRIPVIAVRKVEEDGGMNHDEGVVNTMLEGTESYAIIDDLVASGSTLKRIVRKVRELFPQVKPALILLYQDPFGYDPEVYKAVDDEKITIVRKA